MKPHISSEADSLSACQNTSLRSWEQNFHSRLKKNPPLDPILNQMIPVRTLTLYFLMSYSHLYLRLSR